MKIEVTIRVSKSNSMYSNPSVKKEIVVDIPGSNLSDLNFAGYLETTLSTAIVDFENLPPETDKDIEHD